MKQLTDKQKKAIWIVAGVLLFAHFILPRVINLFHDSHPAQAKPSAAHLAPVPPPPALSPEEVAANKYGGIWQGNELMPDQDRCAIKIEIRLSDDLPRRLKGFESKTCMPVQPLFGGKGARGRVADVIRETAPVSAVLTGTSTSDGIRFTVDSLIGTPYDGCNLTGMTLTAFGQGKMQAQWQSQSSPQTPCPDNRMLLSKVRG
ncbi:MAG TPA: hypothetical protein VMI06_01610 [Terriglobia bacterium]|nr:hypothetical protein [Terriglobia bacterium]